MGRISTKRAIVRPETPEGLTNNFHNDDRDTFVEVNEKIYALVDTGKTLRSLIDTWPENKPQPKVRWLQPIPIRTREEQAEHNADADFIHGLATRSRGSDKITSTAKAIKLGADVPKEIERLLALKESTKDPVEARKIRQQLRKLDYKRYLKKGEE